jgi:hypothetical protein
VLIVMLKYVAVLMCGVLALAGLGVCATLTSADDKKDDKDKPALSGVWVQKGGELKIEFSGKDVMKVFPHGKDVLVILCEYTVEKGVVKAKITDFEGKNEEAKAKVKEKLPVGTEFSFEWKVKGDTARLDYQKGDEHLKSHLEGEFEQKK